ncbi:hypothetical protein [Photobacterium indicum]|uniref:hypothetical protein n=1 Tax=Photobacterium indicum TaxID=81447 RepID=UPI003D1179BA
MKAKTIIRLIAAPLLLVNAMSANSAAYGVSTEWKTEDSQQIFETMTAQKSAFSQLIDAGIIHDVFVRKSVVGDKEFPMIRFVIEADNEESVKSIISQLPFSKKDLVTIVDARDLGNKWLNTELVQENYAIELEWTEAHSPYVVDQILGKDLQQVVDWNTSGKVTSSYLNVQKIEDKNSANSEKLRPIYSIAVLAKDEKAAKEMAMNLEAVKSGLATVKVMHLGFKMNL